MPRRLRQRWQPDSIAEFQRAARQRYDDGLTLASQGRRTGAIYLWGYAAEMVLKAAYFRLTGVPSGRPLTVQGDIRPAIQRGRTIHGLVWPVAGDGHNVRAWAELLIAERLSLTQPYPTDFGRQVQRCGQRIGLLWSESLRYHKNVAYVYELRQVQESLEWLLTNEALL